MDATACTNCTVGNFLENTTCAACDAKCTECMDSTNTVCTACADGNFLDTSGILPGTCDPTCTGS
jgi:hypothetical protein